MAFVFALALQGGLTPAGAQSDEVSDFALFYEALAPYGKWIDYGKYGPVWFPTGESDDWRPYLNGRWTPTEEGWVFETEEPWGWAAYHYGNWFPTIEYGWVWSPGGTWYRPPRYGAPAATTSAGPRCHLQLQAVPAFYPEGLLSRRALWDLLTRRSGPSPHFPLSPGFRPTFSPSYSCGNCGCLAPCLESFLAFRTFSCPIFSFQFRSNACFAFGPAFPFIAG
jgi:hypothetical protein